MGAGSGPRFGVEEEFLVVDRETRAAVPRAAAVIERAGPALGARVGGEITELQIETRTEPCGTVEEVQRQLEEARGALAEAAEPEGLVVVATGTPVLGDCVPPAMTTGPRQDRGNATFRGLHDELAICALHVHVEIPDREVAVLAGNHLRPWLPALIALGANSPFWAERDTGYASWRTMVWSRWPVAGPPPYFTSDADYQRTVAMLHDVGSIVDVGTIFWDIRPSAHVPTLEVRVGDVPMTARESAMTAALIRALAVDAIAKVAAGDPGPRVPAETLRLAYWRAARDGLSGHGVDPATGQLIPAAALADALLTAARPALEDSGDADAVATWLKELTCDGDGATRQRRAASGRGELADVVDLLIEKSIP
ncbi:glutamate--cysteine ligase [Catenulispora subtropica]|uniref:Putative glutamate--cysteine ligase 2 n=1 Tax=Catenulispora subtropica TaxID=450798 RepID=A0ABN2T7B1_9ACTN